MSDVSASLNDEVPKSANEMVEGPAKAKFKGMIKRLVGTAPMPSVALLETVAGTAALSEWLGDHKAGPYFQTRDEIHRWMAREVVRDEPMTLLEFGVYQGNSLLTWAKLNGQRDSVFYGFDSFDGLPDAWRFGLGTMPRGTFDMGGKAPTVHDPRIKLVKGLFADSVPTFLETFQPKGRLLLHMDADLYGSTLCALVLMRGFLKPGTLVMFDEFSCVSHEFRALRDFGASFPLKYRMLASAGAYYDQVALEII